MKNLNKMEKRLYRETEDREYAAVMVWTFEELIHEYLFTKKEFKTFVRHFEPCYRYKIRNIIEKLGCNRKGMKRTIITLAREYICEKSLELF